MKKEIEKEITTLENEMKGMSEEERHEHIIKVLKEAETA